MQTNNEFYIISVEDTKKYGIIRAAILGKIKSWCEYNEKKNLKDKYQDGFWWSGYMSIKEFSNQLGLPHRTIEHNLKFLVDNWIIIRGCYNKKGFDRTGWYRPNNNLKDETHVPPNRVQAAPAKGVSNHPNRVQAAPSQGVSNHPNRVDGAPSQGGPIPISQSIYSLKEKTTSHTSIRSNMQNVELILDAIKTNIKNEELQYLTNMLVTGGDLTRKQKEIIDINKLELIKQVPILEQYLTK